MAKSLKKSATQAATKGAEGVKSVAAEALTVGAVAAAGVVASRVAEALSAGSKKLDDSNPAAQTAMRQVVPVKGKIVTRSKKASPIEGRTNNKRKAPVTKSRRRTSRRKGRT